MLPSWLVFELVGTKLPHYTMPLYPAVALITARGLFAAMSGTLAPRQGWRRFWGSYIWLMVGAAWGIVVPVAIGLGGALTTPSSLVGAIAAGLVVTVSLGALPIIWKALRAGELWRAQAVATAWAVFVLAGLLGLTLPNARSLWITQRLSELSHRASHDGLAREVVFVDHKEDSLVFASRGQPRFRVADDLARELVDRAGDLAAWVSSSRVSSLRDEVQEHSSAARPVHLESLTFFSGFNYAKGKLDTWELVTVETDNPRGRND
jgi:4-amino-4-deoxy-L-arabinose transferase-like glycosyltransferase